MTRKYNKAFISQTSEYRIFHKMKERCYNKNSIGYCNYGGRGIKICDRWLENVINFINDMGIRPSYKYSIERRDNDGDYCPENCYWATDKEQSNNKRNNVLLTFNNKTQNISQWGYELNIRPSIITKRLKRGWSIEDTLSKPVNNGNEKLLSFNGENKSISSWSRELEISVTAIYARLSNGWSIEKALTTKVRR